jgi:hypothetical protein
VEFASPPTVAAVGFRPGGGEISAIRADFLTYGRSHEVWRGSMSTRKRHHVPQLLFIWG